MDWGTQLWDKYDEVQEYIQRGIEFMERYESFIKERISLEEEFASKLKKLSDKHQSKKKDEEEMKMLTSFSAFKSNVVELQSEASLHERLSIQLQEQVLLPLRKHVKSFKERRKQIANEGQTNLKELNKFNDHLEKSKKHYERSHRELVKSTENQSRIEREPASTKADVDKAKGIVSHKTRIYDQTKGEYASALQNFNAAQDTYYSNKLSAVLRKLAELDSERLETLQKLLKSSAQLSSDSLMPLTNVLTACIRHANTIEAVKDQTAIANRFRTGRSPPGAQEFIDLSVTDPPSPGSGGKHVVKKKNFKKEDDDVSNFHQKKEGCTLDELNAEKEHLLRKLVGLQKMKDVYTQNPKLGDARTVGSELAEVQRLLSNVDSKINKLFRSQQSPSLTRTTDSAGYSEIQLRPNNQSQPRDSFDDTATHVAIYDFDGSASGSVRLREGDAVTVLEEDQGDGWTSVRNESNSQIGFVPTAYIKVRF